MRMWGCAGRHSDGKGYVRSVAIRVFVALTLTAVVANGSSALAHRSFAAMYDPRTETIEGVVVQFQFRDPHSFIQVSVRTPAGAEVRYEVEWRGAAQLTRQGVTRLTLNAG